MTPNKFEMGQVVYFMKDNRINAGYVKGYREIDELNIRYYVETTTSVLGIMDAKLFANQIELIVDLLSCIIA